MEGITPRVAKSILVGDYTALYIFLISDVGVAAIRTMKGYTTYLIARGTKDKFPHHHGVSDDVG
jgi:hypothetical protein